MTEPARDAVREEFPRFVSVSYTIGRIIEYRI